LCPKSVGLFYPFLDHFLPLNWPPKKAKKKKKKTTKVKELGGEEKVCCEEIVSFGGVFIVRNGYLRFY